MDIVWRGFLPPSTPLPPILWVKLFISFLNFVLIPLSWLFYLPSFFDWLCDHATSNVLISTCMSTPLVMCIQQLSILSWINNSLISKVYLVQQVYHVLFSEISHLKNSYVSIKLNTAILPTIFLWKKYESLLFDKVKKLEQYLLYRGGRFQVWWNTSFITVQITAKQRHLARDVCVLHTLTKGHSFQTFK